MTDICADDDLVLPAGKHSPHDTLGLFEGIGIKFVAVFQLKTQPCGAMDERADIVLAAYGIEDAGC